jgi:hypothetical protein
VDYDRRIPNEELTSCTSTNSSLSPESVFASSSTSEGSLSASTAGPGDNHRLRIGRVTVGSLKADERRPPESRFSGCPLTISDGSARERWIVDGIFAMLAFSDVRRLCNVCDDRVGGVFVREGARVGWRLLEDDEAQTLSSQSSRHRSGTVPGSEGGVMHERVGSL